MVLHSRQSLGGLGQLLHLENKMNCLPTGSQNIPCCETILDALSVREGLIPEDGAPLGMAWELWTRDTLPSRPLFQ